MGGERDIDIIFNKWRISKVCSLGLGLSTFQKLKASYKRCELLCQKNPRLRGICSSQYCRTAVRERSPTHCLHSSYAPGLQYHQSVVVLYTIFKCIRLVVRPFTSVLCSVAPSSHGNGTLTFIWPLL